MPYDATGTIGSLPCEISLNKILAAKNDPKLNAKIMRVIYAVKHNLSQLKYIPDRKTRLNFKALLRNSIEDRVEKMMGVKVRGVPVTDVVVSHLMCCLHAYFGRQNDGEPGKN